MTTYIIFEVMRPLIQFLAFIYGLRQGHFQFMLCNLIYQRCWQAFWWIISSTLTTRAAIPVLIVAGIKCREATWIPVLKVLRHQNRWALQVMWTLPFNWCWAWMLGNNLLCPLFKFSSISLIRLFWTPCSTIHVFFIYSDFRFFPSLLMVLLGMIEHPYSLLNMRNRENN